jgi:hypothetical protein
MRNRMAYLVVRDHNGKVLQKLTLERSVLIGRSAECDIRVRDTQVSREHCELVPDGKGWKLRDLRSSNGTYINGDAIGECPLKDGDTFEVGSCRIGFFAAAKCRTRAADPVMAGLVDAESAPAGPTKSFELPGHGHSESSLFATRVMVLPSDESTVAGARACFQDLPVTAPNDHLTPVVTSGGVKVGKLTGGMWRAILGAAAAAITMTFIIFWLYFAG